MPALIAFCSAVYWSLPVPALTRLTLTLGYFASKSATTCFSVGSQAQTVMLPPVSRAAQVGVGDAPRTWARAGAPAGTEPPGEPQPAARERHGQGCAQQEGATTGYRHGDGLC